MDPRYKVTKVEKPQRKIFVKKALFGLSILNILITTPVSVKIAAIAYIVLYAKRLSKNYTVFDHDSDKMITNFLKKSKSAENNLYDYFDRLENREIVEEENKRNYKR